MNLLVFQIFLTDTLKTARIGRHFVNKHTAMLLSIEELIASSIAKQRVAFMIECY